MHPSPQKRGGQRKKQALVKLYTDTRLQFIHFTHICPSKEISSTLRDVPNGRKRAHLAPVNHTGGQTVRGHGCTRKCAPLGLPPGLLWLQNWWGGNQALSPRSRPASVALLFKVSLLEKAACLRIKNSHHIWPTAEVQCI